MNFFKLFINYLLIKEQSTKLNDYKMIRNKFLLNYNNTIKNFPIELLFSSVFD